MPLKQTSLFAYDSIKDARSAFYQRIIEFMERVGGNGATDEEIIDGTGIAANTERPRRGELVTHGIITDSGNRRKTKSGRPATVWVLQEYKQ